MNVILLASGAVLAILVLLDMTPGTFSHEWWALTAIVLICSGLVLTEIEGARRNQPLPSENVTHRCSTCGDVHLSPPMAEAS